MTQVPFGFDEKQYQDYMKCNDGMLKYKIGESEKVEAFCRETRQICTHILASRAASRMFPSADGCRDCTREGEKL